MNDQLDRAVRTVLADIIATAPERDDQPIHTVTVDSLEAGRRRPYLMVAAAALAVVGVGGLAIVTNQHAGTTPTSAPTASTPLASDPTASDRPSASPLGPLLPTELEADAIPLVTPGGSGWELTNAFAVSGSPVTGGYEGATVFVGESGSRRNHGGGGCGGSGSG